MSIASVASLVDVLREHELLGPLQLEVVTRQLRALFDHPWALAEELVRREWLSAFQVDLLFREGGGRLVLGPYVLLDRLGEGGMGQVFKARHKTLDRTVALKVIRKDRLAHPDALRRFRREVRAAAQLNHPNIVQAYDAGEVEGTHFFAMEYVEGLDLGRRLRQVGRLPVGEACEYTRQAALGLQHAHDRGLVHRDIKPANLIVGTPYGSEPPLLKILDMGLALVLQGSEEDPISVLNRDGVMMGTLDYLAPEQALDSHQVDIRADLYGLGCTLYHMLTGSVPFPAGSMMERLLKHRMDEPRPVEELRPETPPGVAVIVKRLLAKRANDRFDTPTDLAAALVEMAPPYLPPVPKERTALVRRVSLGPAAHVRTDPDCWCPPTVVIGDDAPAPTANVPPEPAPSPAGVVPDDPLVAPPRSRVWTLALLVTSLVVVVFLHLSRPAPQPPAPFPTARDEKTVPPAGSSKVSSPTPSDAARH